MISIELRRSTTLADARRREPSSDEAIVRTGRRCRSCAKVGAADEWPRQPGPFSTPAFATGAVVVIAVALVLSVVMAGSAA